MKQTIIVRHTRENLKKCSLRGLEKKPEFLFFTYPDCAQGKEKLPDLSNFLLLDLAGAPLSPSDCDKGLILLDATWRLAKKMSEQIKDLQSVERRSMPGGFQTAYPRRQDDCPDPMSGLASIEALYIAFFIMGRPCDCLLDNYYWKEQFLEINQPLLPCNIEHRKL